MAAQRIQHLGLISDKAHSDRNLDSKTLSFKECLKLALEEKKTHYIVPELIAKIGDAPVDNTFVGVVKNWFEEKSNIENAYKDSVRLNSFILFIVKILKYCHENDIGNIDRSIVKAIKNLQIKTPVLLSSEQKELLFSHVQNELPALIPILEQAFNSGKRVKDILKEGNYSNLDEYRCRVAWNNGCRKHGVDTAMMDDIPEIVRKQREQGSTN